VLWTIRNNPFLIAPWGIRRLTMFRGRLISSDFMELPPKRRYPDYYVTIKRPIAIEEIKAKIENGEYENAEALKDDLTIMTSNAKKYNVKGSSIYEDAVLIQVTLPLR